MDKQVSRYHINSTRSSEKHGGKPNKVRTKPSHVINYTYYIYYQEPKLVHVPAG
jgi:hypothetical protein